MNVRANLLDEHAKGRTSLSSWLLIIAGCCLIAACGSACWTVVSRKDISMVVKSRFLLSSVCQVVAIWPDSGLTFELSTRFVCRGSLFIRADVRLTLIGLQTYTSFSPKHHCELVNNFRKTFSHLTVVTWCLLKTCVRVCMPV